MDKMFFLEILFALLGFVGLLSAAFCLFTVQFKTSRDKGLAVFILLLFTFGAVCCLSQLIESKNQPGKIVYSSTETVTVDKDTLFEIQSDNAEFLTYSSLDKNLPAKIATSTNDISVKNKEKRLYFGKIAVDKSLDNGESIKFLKIKRKITRKNIFLLGEIEFKEDSATALSK